MALRAWGEGPARSRRTALVLCYHNFGDASGRDRGFLDPRRRLPADVFRPQMEWLDRVADVVPLSRITEPSGSRLRVAITVDDGYLNNIHHMFPVLESMGLPATWFVATDFVDDPGRLPWWDLLDFLVARKRGVVDLRDVGIDIQLDLARPGGPERLHREVRGAMKSASPTLLRSMLDCIQGQNPDLEIPPNAFARPDEVRAATASGCIEPGGHTAGHPNLASCRREEIHVEIERGRDRIEEICGRRPNWFAYPFGGPGAVSPEAAEVVRECGFDGGVSTVTGVVEAASPAYMLPRITISPGTGLGEFKAFVRGARAFATMRRRGSRSSAP